MNEGKKMQGRFRTTNWSEYNMALKSRGRNQTCSDAAIQSRLSITCLFGQPLRHSLGVTTPGCGGDGQQRVRCAYVTPRPVTRSLLIEVQW